MKDFTFNAYKNYIQAIKSSFRNIMRFDEFFLADPKPDDFCIIRHDVDRKPVRALKMAELEKDLGIRATYYFRTKPHIFKQNIIQRIESLGHEIGYHYECLSDTNGDISLAIKDFENNLDKIRKIAIIKTIAMHGRPFSRYDNRDIWRKPENHCLLKDKYKILGEIYLDIDYKNIAYINDTGRNWTSRNLNIRDKVNSDIKLDFNDGNELLYFFRSNPKPRIVFQVHPERWTSSIINYYLSLMLDSLINDFKRIRYLAMNKFVS